MEGMKVAVAASLALLAGCTGRPALDTDPGAASARRAPVSEPGPSPTAPVVGTVEFGMDSPACCGPAPMDQSGPAVAAGAGIYLAVWTDQRSGVARTYASRVDAQTLDVLDPLGFDVLPGAAGALADPAVAFDGTNFLVVGSAASGGVLQIFGQRIQATATPSVPPVRLDGNLGFQITTGAQPRSQPAVVHDPASGHSLVAFSTLVSPGKRHLFGSRVTTGGASLDPAGVPLATGDTAGVLHDISEPSLAVGPAGFLYGVWREVSPVDGPLLGSGRFSIGAGGITAHDGALGSPLGTYSGARGPRLSRDPVSAQFLVVWQDGLNPGGSILARQVDVPAPPAAITLPFPELPLPSPPASPLPPSTLFDGTNHLVAWRADDRTVRAVRVQTPTAAPASVIGAPVVASTDADAFAAGVALGGSSSLLAWTRGQAPGLDIAGARVTPAGALLDPPPGKLISTSSNGQTKASIARGGDGRFLVVWEDNRTLTGDIRGALVTPGATITSPPAAVVPITISANPAAGETEPRAAFSGSRFLVVWTDTRDAATCGSDVYGARVAADGTVEDPGGFLVSLNGAGCDAADQSAPWVAAHNDASNRWTVVWTDRRAGNPDIYGARVEPAGQVADATGLAIATTPGTEQTPRLACSGGTGTHCMAWWASSGAPPAWSWTLYDKALGQPGATSAFLSSADLRVAHGAGVYAVAYGEGEDLFLRRFDELGVEQGLAIQLSAAGAVREPQWDLAFDGFNFLAAWSNQPSPYDRPATSVQARRISPLGEFAEAAPFAVGASLPWVGDLAIGGTMNRQPLIGYTRYVVNPVESGRVMGRFVLLRDVPASSDGNLELQEDTPTLLTLGCRDPDGDPLTASIVRAPARGALSGSGVTRTYTPNANFFGVDDFTFNCSDGTTTTATATFFLKINPVNDLPTLSDIPDQTMVEDTSRTVSFSAVDTDGFLSMSGLSTDPALVPSGGLVFAGSGASRTLTITPAANRCGTATITVRANDGLTTVTDTFLLTVTCVNDLPVASNGSVATFEDTPVDLTAVCTDAEGEQITWTILSGTTRGALTGDAGAYRYAPNANYAGPDSFTFQCQDPSGGSSAVATFNITVTQVNDAPTITDIPDTTTPEESAATVSFTVGDVETPATGLTVTAMSSNAALVPNANLALGPVAATRTLTATPLPNQCGTTTITVRVSDNNVITPDSFVLTVECVNDPPVAANRSGATAEDTAATVTLSCTDVDGPALSYVIVTPPQHGAVSGSGPAVTYTPAANYHGPDSFEYRCQDGAADSNLATVTLTVTPVPDAPVASGSSVPATEDTPAAVHLGCSDADGDALSYTVVSAPASGTLSGIPPDLVYTPQLNFNGVDGLTFRCGDGSLTSTTEAITITVQPVNDAPVAQDASVNTPSDTPVDVALQASDVEGSALAFQVVGPPAHGTLSGSGGTRTYTPAAGYVGPDQLTFTASDGSATSNVATVTITVGPPPNRPPSALVGAASTDEDSARAITLQGSDPDGNPLTYAIALQPAHGTLSGVPPQVTYTPAGDFNGEDRFSFTVSDGQATSAPAEVVLTVLPVNDPPNAPELNQPEDGAVFAPGGVSLYWLVAADVDGDDLSYRVVVERDGQQVFEEATKQTESHLAGEHALGVGVYTWRVETIDQASVSSGFSPARTFIVQPPTRCATCSTGAGGGAGWLAMLGALGVLARRRRGLH